jgi:hypothetical protein
MFQPSNIDGVADQNAKLLESVERRAGTLTQRRLKALDVSSQMGDVLPLF